MSGAMMAAALLSFVLISAGGADDFTRQRHEMVARQIEARGVKDTRVLEAMRRVPRHLFVPDKERPYAYDDSPLPIGEGQTISQPYIVAYMTEALDLKRTDKVLEIGTGSGYQAAVLAEIVERVYSIEIVPSLAERAKRTLASLGYGSVEVRQGDGYKGWPEQAPFDAIIVTCAPNEVPEELKAQLAEGGRMIIPVGRAGSVQTLVKAVKRHGVLQLSEEMAVRFVPMVRQKREP
jgi:protein-L-isoaspartate(D-aspartate) O-methyltransferase